MKTLSEQIRDLTDQGEEQSLDECRDDESAWSKNVWSEEQGGNRVDKDGEEERTIVERPKW